MLHYVQIRNSTLKSEAQKNPITKKTITFSKPSLKNDHHPKKLLPGTQTKNCLKFKKKIVAPDLNKIKKLTYWAFQN